MSDGQAIDTQLESRDTNQSRPVQVELFGRDGVLLHYRSQVLSSTGLATRVTTLSRDRALSVLPCAPVAVLCHTLTSEDREAISIRLREGCPETRIAAMASGSIEGDEARSYDALIESFAGPGGLIKVVRELLRLPAVNDSGHSN